MKRTTLATTFIALLAALGAMGCSDDDDPSRPATRCSDLETVEPDEAARLVEWSRPRYPLFARRNGWEGTAIVRAWAATDSTVCGASNSNPTTSACAPRVSMAVPPLFPPAPTGAVGPAAGVPAHGFRHN